VIEALYVLKTLALKSGINFFKYSTDYFVCYNLIRTFDYCFVATENQITKNHNLFINFIEYLESKRINKKFIFIGDISKIKQTLFNELKYVHFEYIPRCDKNKLIEIYNLSKVNIIFSGRDSYPRVIAESLSCGCFNIALDTLSDGKDIYDGYFGKLIGDPNINKVLINKSSLCYKNNDTLWDKILSSVPDIIDHNEISIKFKEKYNIDTFINSL
jgi:glycosyltransferase involved in cell wall biosynthesis